MSVIDGKEEKVDGGSGADPWDAEMRQAERLARSYMNEIEADDSLMRRLVEEAARRPAYVRDLHADRLTDREGRVEGVDR